MKKSQRLQVIIDLKAREEKKYLEALGLKQTEKQQKESQVDNLTNYRKDYLDKNAEQLENGISVFRLIEFKAFLEKMDKAITGEKQALEQMANQVNELKKQWEKAHLNTKNIEKIQFKARVSEQKELEKKEQLEMDERTARKKRSGTNAAY